jgi:transcriptional regulator with XRE-family HTH domain
MKLDKQLKSLIRESDITVAQLARATHVSPKTIYNWLAGQKPRDLDAVKRVAEHFKISIEKLCYGIEVQISAKAGELEKHLDEVNAGIFEVVLRRVRK